MKPIPKYIAILLVIIGFYACASTGSPDGGPYDEDPPKFIRAIPEPNATNNTRKKISIEFDEFIKLENASEKVIISPPQKESPEVKTSGKRDRKACTCRVFRYFTRKYYLHNRLRRCYCRQ